MARKAVFSLISNSCARWRIILPRSGSRVRVSFPAPVLDLRSSKEVRKSLKAEGLYPGFHPVGSTGNHPQPRFFSTFFSTSESGRAAERFPAGGRLTGRRTSPSHPRRDRRWTMSLTDTAVRQAKPAAKGYTLKDAEGLALFVSAKGTRSWHFRFSWADKQPRISLGTY
jgi:hypothetical protein